jgi:repressor of nif and glnA expression
MDMDIDAQRKIAHILRVLADAGRPIGSTRIASQLSQRGIAIKQRMVRYYLEEMDSRGFTENLGRAGRRLTPTGRQELDAAVALDRVGFVSARVDQLAYKLSFDMHTKTGTVILNVSSVPLPHLETARKILRNVIRAGLGMGSYVVEAEAGQTLAGYTVPADEMAIGTVCSVTLNGVLHSRGIPMVSRFGGLLEVRQGAPSRFTQIIHYDGTTIDPIEIFIKGRMTGVDDAARTGNGTIGASFREIPAAALPHAREIIEKLDTIGLNGVLAVGSPGNPLLDIPVSPGRVGLIIAAGLNPVAAIEERDIPTQNHAMETLCEFQDLQPLTDI